MLSDRVTLVFAIVLILLSSSSGILSAELLTPPNVDSDQRKEALKWKDYFRGYAPVEVIPKEGSKKYINELVLSHSPYLIQHQHNPINWKPWSKKLLEKAKKNNKLIFLSIGYSTCHWCHVMKRESFNNLSIAKILNEKYISIKVDREELPHVDQYYTSALQQAKGEAGWPITAIINGDGYPLYIDSYLPQKKLNTILLRLDQIWKNSPEFLVSTAENLHSLIAEEKHDQEFYQQQFTSPKINLKLISKLDASQGGYLGEVKFPSEAMLLYVLDQLRRTANPELERLLQLQLDNMMSQGLYDHVGGGFHRYATDQIWLIPHYEKMLYNQSQLLQVYLQAYQYFYQEKYLTVASEIANSLLKDFYIKPKGFISAFDAEFEEREGDYYLWSKDEIDEINLDKKLYSIYKNKQNDKVGVLFVSMSDKNIQDQINSAKAKLLSNRASRGTPHFDSKILTGWNGQAIKSLIDAGEMLDKKKYIELAIKLAKRLWTKRFDESTGHLNRTDYDSVDKGLVFLEDYAYLADSFIKIYDHTGDKGWLTKVKKLVEASEKYFLSNNGGFYNSSDRTSHVSNKISADSELYSPLATLIDVKGKLSNRFGKDGTKKNLKKHKEFLHSRINEQPLNHLYSSLIISNINDGDSYGKRYFAGANGEVDFVCLNISNNICQQLRIEISLNPGWHINSNSPLQEYLIPTAVDLPKSVLIDYPMSKNIHLGFQTEPLSVYEGEVAIKITKEKKSNERYWISLPLQACNDKYCMLPESVNFIF